jgi:uncharacterized C2H2 Zn-finger protein
VKDEEYKEAEADFIRCPFCSCIFFTKTDLDKHLAAFGHGAEQHGEAHRRIHGRREYESAE